MLMSSHKHGIDRELHGRHSVQSPSGVAGDGYRVHNRKQAYSLRNAAPSDTRMAADGRVQLLKQRAGVTASLQEQRLIQVAP